MALGLQGTQSFGDYTDPFYQQPTAGPAPAPAPTSAPEPVAPGPDPAPAQDQGGLPEPNPQDEINARRLAGRPEPGAPPNPGVGPPPPPPTLQGAAQGSEATGGVQGSFAQAGTSGFNRRFGGNSPALWYRQNLDTLGGSPTSNRASGRQRNAQVAARSGGAGGGSLPAPNSAAGGDFGGEDPNNAGMDWEQFLKSVQGNMFGGGR